MEMAGRARIWSTASARRPRAGLDIVLIDANPADARLLRHVLQRAGHRVRHAASVAGARALLAGCDPDLIVLDFALPDGEGLATCADLSAQTGAPILVCSAVSRQRDRVLALYLGADDYVMKPFDSDELLARIQAVARRSRVSPRTTGSARPAPGGSAVETAAGTAMSRVLRVGALVIDAVDYLVRLAEVEIGLTPTEFRLLHALMQRPDEVVPRNDLARIVWGYYDPSIGRSIDVHLCQIRAKLERASRNSQGRNPPPEIITKRGHGIAIIASSATAGEVEPAVQLAIA